MKRKHVFFTKRLNFSATFDVFNLELLSRLQDKRYTRYRYALAFNNFTLRGLGFDYHLALRPNVRMCLPNRRKTEPSIFSAPFSYKDTLACMKIDPRSSIYSVHRRFVRTTIQQVSHYTNAIPRDESVESKLQRSEFKLMYCLFFDIYHEIFDELNFFKFTHSLTRLWSIEEWWHSKNVVWFSNAWVKSAIVRYPYWIAQPYFLFSIVSLLLFNIRLYSDLHLYFIPRYSNVVYNPWVNVWKRYRNQQITHARLRYGRSRLITYSELYVFLVILWVLYFTVRDLESVHLFSARLPKRKRRKSLKTRRISVRSVLKPVTKYKFEGRPKLIYRQDSVFALLSYYVERTLAFFVLIRPRAVVDSSLDLTRLLTYDLKRLLYAIRRKALSRIVPFSYPNMYGSPFKTWDEKLVGLRLVDYKAYYSYNNTARPALLFLVTSIFFINYIPIFLAWEVQKYLTCLYYSYTTFKSRKFSFVFFKKLLILLKYFLFTNPVSSYFIFLIKSVFIFFSSLPVTALLQNRLSIASAKIFSVISYTTILAVLLLFVVLLANFIHFFKIFVCLLFLLCIFLLVRGRSKSNLFDQFVESPFRWYTQIFFLFKRFSFVLSRWLTLLIGAFVILFSAVLAWFYRILSLVSPSRLLNYFKMLSFELFGSLDTKVSYFVPNRFIRGVSFFDYYFYNWFTLVLATNARFKLTAILNLITVGELNWLFLNILHLSWGRAGWWVKASSGEFLSLYWREKFDYNNLMQSFGLGLTPFSIPLKTGRSSVLWSINFMLFEILFSRLAVSYSKIVNIIQTASFSWAPDALLVMLNDVTVNLLFLDSWGRFRRANFDRALFLLPFSVSFFSFSVLLRQITRYSIILVFSLLHFMIQFINFLFRLLVFLLSIVCVFKVVGFIVIFSLTWFFSHPLLFSVYLFLKMILILSVLAFFKR